MLAGSRKSHLPRIPAMENLGDIEGCIAHNCHRITGEMVDGIRKRPIGFEQSAPLRRYDIDSLGRTSAESCTSSIRLLDEVVVVGVDRINDLLTRLTRPPNILIGRAVAIIDLGSALRSHRLVSVPVLLHIRYLYPTIVGL